MLAKAKSLAPEIDWVEASAVALPFPDRSFEVVIAQQVLQFVPDRAAAAREIRRVLVPGGRLIASTWRPRVHQPLFEALGQVAEKHLGPGNDKRWSLDGDELRTLLVDAGFTDVHFDTASLEERHSVFPIQASTAGAGYTNVDPATMATIEGESKPILECHTTADGAITNRSITNVVVARVP
jgi:SAM-dependent methyltransferase